MTSRQEGRCCVFRCANMSKEAFDRLHDTGLKVTEVSGVYRTIGAWHYSMLA